MNSGPKIGDIMIVDDTLHSLRLLSKMLEERGYQVRAALNGHRALAAIISSPPDLILLNITMPGIDGYEVCRRLKADPRTSHIPVLFISALSGTEDKVKGFSVGGVDYITKPFQIEEVLARVETHLNLRRLQEEIAERRHAEEVVTASLREKEMLLREVHHRVKNNLQVISSLLYLQSKKATDSKTLEMLKDSQNRIKSMALVHEKLSATKQARIDFSEYIRNLAANLIQSYGRGQISLRMDLDCASINPDTAIPCGLIINELVSNSIKHAFPDGRSGEICIELHSKDCGRFLIVVSDTGVGLKADLVQSDTLGLQLVNTLIKQIDGQMKMDSSTGTRYEIDFRELNYRERC